MWEWEWEWEEEGEGERARALLPSFQPRPNGAWKLPSEAATLNTAQYSSQVLYINTPGPPGGPLTKNADRTANGR